MIKDARRDPLPAKADVVIIGSGAAGVTLARALEGEPLQVLLLEAGGLGFSRSAQAAYRAERVSPWTHFAGEFGRRRAFGGTTAIWGGRCIPLDPIDFVERDWIPHSGWPIGPEVIEPYLQPAMDVLQAGLLDFDSASLDGDPSPIANSADPIFDLRRVERYSLPLDFGKYYRSELAKSQNVQCFLNCPVLKIIRDNDVLSGVEVPGAFIRSSIVVIATGGVETPRILLASGIGGANVGRYYQTHIRIELGRMSLKQSALADFQRSKDSIWCRRYIAFDPEAQRELRLPNIVLRPLNNTLADPSHGNPILSLMFLVKSILIKEYRSIIIGNRSTEKGVDVGDRSTYGRHFENILKGIAPLSAFLFRWIRQRVLAKRKLPSAFLVSNDGNYRIDLQMEQVPNPESRITLGSQRDAYGVPRVCIDWRTMPEDRAGLERVLKALRQARLSPAADGSLDIDPGAIDLDHLELFPVPAHHIGTARMGASPERAVCDANCEVFDTKGLYVSGAALFTTSGFANPTLMIVALALRLADHIKSKQLA